MKLVKAYYHDSEDKVIGQVKFETYTDDTIADESVIYDNAPEGWVCCCWSNGTVKNNKKSKKSKKEKVDEMIEELETITSEDNGDSE